MTLIRGLVTILLVVLLTHSGTALPRFASRTGMRCQSCHVNPSGGAMRQALGVQYGREELPVPAWSKDFEMEDFTNVITNVLGVGADFRTLYYYQKLSDTSRFNGLMQMQGDLYLNLRIAKKVALFFKKGLRQSFEAFGLFTFLPASGHIKVGKFVPNFGTKLDDHTAYIRQRTGFSPDVGVPERTGVEAAMSPGPISVMAGFYNADEGSIFPNSSEKAVLGRLEGRFKLADQLFLGLGGDVFSKKVADARSTYYGGFGSFGVFQASLVGELDWIRTTDLNGTTTGLVTYLEGSYPVLTGLEVTLTYDFYDEDIDYKTGTTSRYSLGVEFFPIAGVEFRPVYRFIKDGAGNRNEIDVLLHLYL